MMRWSSHALSAVYKWCGRKKKCALCEIDLGQWYEMTWNPPFFNTSVSVEEEEEEEEELLLETE